MASSYVNDLRLNEMATGDASGTWGTVTNTNLELIAEAFSYGTENMGSDANTTITVADGATDEARSLYMKVTSTSLSADRTVTLAPNTLSKVWIIENATTGGKAITIKQGTGATIDIPNGDVKMVATDGAGSGGAVYDLLVDLNIATKLTIKNPSTSDDTPATLLLQTGDTDIAADDKLGVINFQAPDEGAGTDAILVAAGIEAVSEGDFSSSSNATKLSFKTASSEAAAEKMSLSSAGLLTIADDLVIGDGKTIGSSTTPAAITIASDGDLTASGDLTVTGAAKISHPTQIFIPTSNLVPSTDNTQETLTNWADVDGNVPAARGQTSVGSLVSQSSGIFSFSETGKYLIIYNMMMQQHTVTYAGGLIYATLNNSTYNALGESYSSTTSTSGSYFKNASVSATFDVTNTTNCKMKFNILANVTNVTFNGNADICQTHVVFQKIGET